MKNNISAKDRAFAVERVQWRQERNELLLQVKKEKQIHSDLRDEINELKYEIEIKNEWIDRLLEFTELTKDEVQLVINNVNQNKKVKDNINGFDSMLEVLDHFVSSFGGGIFS